MATDTSNPLLTTWYLEQDLPDFSKIEPIHFGPAIEHGLAAHEAEVDAIAEQDEPPSFENTIEAMEKAGLHLRRTASIFGNLAGAHTNDDLQALERDLSPKFAAHHNKISANEKLFARIADLWNRRDSLNLSDEQIRVLERSHDGFVRAGANLKGANKERLGDIKKRLAELGTAFSQNVLGDEAEFVLPLHEEDDLKGLPDFLRSAMAAAAKEREADAPYVVTLSRSLIEPFLTFSDRRDLRETAFKAWAARGENGNARDNRAIIAEVLKLRQERAELLGFATFGDYKLDDSMAERPANVRELLETVWAPARAKAAQEQADLEALARSEGVNEPIEAWDWRYWAEKVRGRDFNLDEGEIKQYFALDNMIEAAFHTAHRLFGLSFKERFDLTLYHPDVRAWDVTGPNGEPVGLFLGDYFARASKRSGAWMSGYRSQQRLENDIRPIIVNVMNFAKGADGAPALLSFDDARTLFHEFGHGLHGLLSDVTYPSLAGTSVERDFVELPSQLYEHWLETPEILEQFARHHETGKPMPADLLERLRAAGNFNQGFSTVEYLGSALVDLAFHDGSYKGDEDPLTFEAKVLEQIGMPNAIIMRHRSPHFLHVFSGDGYSSGYYSYMWSEVLDADAFTAFEERRDPFDPETADKLRRYIYAAGGTRKGAEAYKLFRGKLPAVEGLLRQRGLAA